MEHHPGRFSSQDQQVYAHGYCQRITSRPTDFLAARPGGSPTTVETHHPSLFDWSTPSHQWTNG